MAKNINSRANAARVLQRLLRHQGSLASQLARLPAAPATQQSETREFCYGVMRWYFQLEPLLAQLLEKPLRDKDGDVHALLLIGLYQLLHMRTPAHAAVSETVSASKALKKPWAKGLINGVLRNAQRNNDSLQAQLTQSQQYAFPDWLWQRLQQHWPAELEDLVAASNARPPMTLRVNAAHANAADYQQQLHAAGLGGSTCQFSPQALTLDKPCDVHSLPGFAEGRVSVQDEAAQLAAGLLNAEPGQRVLDACSAPGGKALHLLETHPGLTLDCIDNDEARLQRVAENLQRGQQQARVLLADASQPELWAEQTYQRILLDAPCSATGVIRRNPDIKYLRRNADIDTLNALQRQILQACWTVLEPGGELLYATCSILPEENEHIIAAFVETHSDATHDPIVASWGIERRYGRQLLPAAHDGFYYARLRKQPTKRPTKDTP